MAASESSSRTELMAQSQSTPTVQPTEELLTAPAREKQNKTEQKEIPEANAWMHLQSIVDEINIKERYFSIEGWIAIFWKDGEFKLETFQNDIKSMKGDSENRKEDAAGRSMTSNANIESQPVSNDDEKKEDIEVKREEGNENERTYKNGGEEMSYVILTEHIEHFRPRKGSWTKGKYGNIFPFRDERLPFKNAMDISFPRSNSIELAFNKQKKVFKLHIAFKAKFNEYFENIDQEFPFEWQFLNMMIPYNPAFKFAAALPDFVEEAFVYKEYWDFGPDMWSHAVVVEKRVNLEGWNLLDSWVDLRGSNLEGSRWDKVDTAKKRNEYGNYIIIPLELMVTSAFSIFFLSFEEDEDEYHVSLGDRLQILVTLILTVAAFQLQISRDMPFSDQYTLIDQYFLLAYFVLWGLVAESSIVNVIVTQRIYDAVWGVLFFLLWQIHSLQFAFKYFNFGGYGTGQRFWSKKTLLRISCCGLYGFSDAVKMCMFTSCGGCCRKSKRHRRLRRWLRAEMNESALWNDGPSEQQKVAEIVLGTCGDVNFERGDKRLREDRKKFVEELKAEYGVPRRKSTSTTKQRALSRSS